MKEADIASEEEKKKRHTEDKTHTLKVKIMFWRKVV